MKNLIKKYLLKNVSNNMAQQTICEWCNAPKLKWTEKYLIKILKDTPNECKAVFNICSTCRKEIGRSIKKEKRIKNTEIKKLILM